MALANRERGTDSLGLFDSSGSCVKLAEDPLFALGESNVSDFLSRARQKSWFLAGHTRLATRGSVTDGNAHPFRYGNIIGAHNGQVQAPNKYEVDSMFMFEQLAKNGGDYQLALEGVSGYWSLTWFDGASLFMQCHGNTLATTRVGNCWYYSSDEDHLAACVGASAIEANFHSLGEGETLQFSLNKRKPKTLPRFKSSAGAKKAKRKTMVKTAPDDCCQTGFLSSADFSDANSMARSAGFRDLADFMQAESVCFESQAYDMLFSYFPC